MELVRKTFENLPDIDAAFEAVRGQLFGPLDPALVTRRHKEILQDHKEKREQEFDPHGRLRLAGDDRAERDRKDRLEALLLTITSQRLAEKLRETYKAFDGIRETAQELLDRIDNLLKDARRDYQDLLNNTARHPVTGDAIFRYKDGRIETEDGRAVARDKVARVDFDGKATGEQKDAGQSRISELEHYREEVTGITARAESHQNRITDPALDEDEREQAVDDAAKDADGMQKRLEEIDHLTVPELAASQEVRREGATVHGTATDLITVPKL